MEEQKNTNEVSEEKKVGETSEGQENKSVESEAAKKADPKDVEENKAVAMLSYISILFLVPLLAKKDSEFCHFHAKQGLVLFLLEVAGMILTPFLGLGFLVQIAALVFAIIGIIAVLDGEMKKLPLIGDFADKFNL